MSSPSLSPARPSPGDLRGLLIAGVVFVFWSATLVGGLALPLEPTPVLVLGALLLAAVRTFLYVGLFITAHDAMHGLVAPDRPRLNRNVGRVALWLYAGLRYDVLRAAHLQHHEHPGRPADPDGHSDPRFVPWLQAFVRRYVDRISIGWNAVVVSALVLAGVPETNIALFLVFPAWLSVLQLFTFGTWLPHRPSAQPFTDEHRARSADVAPLWSFLSCYHFGYHWEHHEFPWVPWWGLPDARAHTKAAGTSAPATSIRA